MGGLNLLTRREVFAFATLAGTRLDEAAAMNLTLRPYAWSGPYAQYRDANRATHDAGLCAELRASWMKDGERIILRTSEVVGYPDGFLYDDHLPASEADGRGKGYTHRPFRWQLQTSGS